MSDNNVPDQQPAEDPSMFNHKERMDEFLNKILTVPTEPQQLELTFKNKPESAADKRGTGGFKLRFEFDPNIEEKPVLFVDYEQMRGFPGKTLVESVTSYVDVVSAFQSNFPKGAVTMFYSADGLAFPGADAPATVFTGIDGRPTFLSVLRHEGHSTFLLNLNRFVQASINLILKGVNRKVITATGADKESLKLQIKNGLKG